MKLSRRDAWFLLFSVALLVITAPVMGRLLHHALDFEQNNDSHIVLVPFVSAVLIFLSREKIFHSVRYALLPGLSIAALGVVLFVGGNRWTQNFVESDRLAVLTAGVVLLWLGGFILFFGTVAFRAALFPLLFLVLLIPIPSVVSGKIITTLQHGSAQMAFWVLRLTGTPVYRQGVILAMPDLTVEVAPQCSGIRSGISLFILCLLAGHLLLRSVWRWGALMIAAIPILIFKNALRIAALSLLAIHVDKRIMTSEWHHEGGIPFFAMGLLLLYPVLLMLVKSEGRAPRPQALTHTEAEI